MRAQDAAVNKPLTGCQGWLSQMCSTTLEICCVRLPMLCHAMLCHAMLLLAVQINTTKHSLVRLQKRLRMLAAGRGGSSSVLMQAVTTSKVDSAEENLYHHTVLMAQCVR